MSRRALCLAVRNRIRSVLGYANKDCNLTLPGGQPWPVCGDYFVGVWPGARRSNKKNQGQQIDTRYDVVVTFTARITTRAWDRLGDWLATEESGVWDKVEAIENFIGKDVNNFHVANAANKIIGDKNDSNEPVGFREALQFVGDSIPRTVGPDWFNAVPGKFESGLVIDMYFGLARRIQNAVNIAS